MFDLIPIYTIKSQQKMYQNLLLLCSIYLKFIKKGTGRDNYVVNEQIISVTSLVVLI